MPVAVRGPAMAALTEFGTPATWAQIYEMLFRARVAGLEIDRITQALTVNPPEALRATVADRMAALRRVFAQSRPDCDVVPGLVPSSLELRRRFDDPPHVTIAIVPGRKPNGATAADLLRSLGRTDWPMDRLHVIVADDTASRMERAWPFDVRTAVTEHLQTQVARANQLWHACQTEQLIFLDEGLLVHEPRWLHALLTFAVDEGVGGVGARLRDWYASNGFPANPDDHTAASVHRECSMVSCEAFATKRSVLEQVNGLDERFGFANSVADLCLRLRLLGMRVVCTPHAGFAERDSPPPEPDETALFLQKWHDYLAHDPASHPRLEHSRFEGESDLSDDDWWRQRLNKRLNSPPSDTGGTGGTTGVSGAVHVE